MAEWLGNGLQNHVQRFESARDLKLNPDGASHSGFFVGFPFKPRFSSENDKKPRGFRRKTGLIFVN